MLYLDEDTLGRGSMKRVRLALQHKMNPLHVYCRLRGVGCGRKGSMLLAKAYERTLYKVVFILTNP
jgi:hypothetical protein